MRLALRLVAVFAALGVAALAAIAVAIATLDVDTLLGPLRERVKALTGRELAIGAVDVQVSLVPRIVLSDVALANAPWGKAADLATVRRAEVRIELRPLLSRRIDIVEVVLAGPAIALETDAHGVGN